MNINFIVFLLLISGYLYLGTRAFPGPKWSVRLLSTFIMLFSGYINEYNTVTLIFLVILLGYAIMIFFLKNLGILSTTRNLDVLYLLGPAIYLMIFIIRWAE
ncbi:hypothetical protein CKY04_09730 [Photorhabdus sp. S8-52]|nr:hypothetical protein CKY05_09645 [Photorhabdus sp. S10-54]RAW99597.1 hypothetical protein CKY03_09170 [Photorhabdus sp. S9-53]RAX03804.1 hypothetical protein CKY04_09730 [Photorhabdus sp. S8-52]